MILLGIVCVDHRLAHPPEHSDDAQFYLIDKIIILWVDRCDGSSSRWPAALVLTVCELGSITERNHSWLLSEEEALARKPKLGSGKRFKNLKY